MLDSRNDSAVQSSWRALVAGALCVLMVGQPVLAAPLAGPPAGKDATSLLRGRSAAMSGSCMR